MKRVWLIVMLGFAGRCGAQSACNPAAIAKSAAQVAAVQRELRQSQVGEMEEEVWPEIADRLTRLKNALSRAADAALACAKHSGSPQELQRTLIQSLHANGSQSDDFSSLSKGDPRYDEEYGSYGHNLRVGVSHPPGGASLLQIEFSINIECGDDTMLLIYELHHGHWVQRLRWQSPPLQKISDAFGDFLLSTVVSVPDAPGNKDSSWRLVVAHGTPWCTSRWGNFKMDLLQPGRDPASPSVGWRLSRGLSRGDFVPILKTFGNEFELRVNTMCLDLSGKCYERHVIYRYRLESDGRVVRVGPIATNARGFVEEWLAAPWSDLSEVTAAESASGLEGIHENFDPKPKSNSEFLSHSYGPVRACSKAGLFQVQIDSKLNRIVPGNRGGDSKSLPSLYFRVRESKTGYVMSSAGTEPDPSCSGPDLMPVSSEGGA